MTISAFDHPLLGDEEVAASFSLDADLAAMLSFEVTTLSQTLKLIQECAPGAWLDVVRTVITLSIPILIAVIFAGPLSRTGDGAMRCDRCAGKEPRA